MNNFNLKHIHLLLVVVEVDGSDNSLNKKVKVSKYKYAVKNINKAKKYEKKNKLEKAEKHYKKAIEYLLEENKINPANPDTFNYLGVCT